MPDQNQSDPSQTSSTPAVPTGGPPDDQSISPPPFSAASDLPPIPPAFQNIPADDANSPAAAQPADETKDDSINAPVDTPPDAGSAAPPDTPPIISTPKKKFGGGRVIATILGVLLLIGGIGAGIFLTQQSQELREKADTLTSPDYNLDIPPCSNIGTGLNCSGGSVGGSTACRQNNTQVVSPVNCCPPGQTIRNGSCSNDAPRCNDGRCETGEAQSCPGDCGGSALPQCGTNLDCSFGVVSGASQCKSGGDSLFCCPQGQHMLNGSCVAGVHNPCGSGLSCGQFAHSGTTSCTEPSSGRAVNCCPSGQTYDNSSGCSGGGASSAISCGSVACVGTPGTAGASCSTGTTATNCRVFRYHCPGILAPGQSCDDTHHSGALVGEGSSQSFTQTCGTEQIDIQCAPCGLTVGNNLSGVGANLFRSIRHATACSGGGGGGSPPPGNPIGQCVNVKAFDESWVFLSGTDLAGLIAGDVVNFCVAGSASSGVFDKAQFKINATLNPETTTHRPSSTDFCQSYTITPSDTTVTVKAKIHHETLNNWFGEPI